MPQPQKDAKYTYAEYLQWDGPERIELHNGTPVMMSPPSRLHQKIAGEIFRQIANYLEGKPCEVYPAPFAVRLFENAGDTPEQISTVYEPDITIVCDRSKLDDRGCKGAPDMVIEVLSPSTARNDRLVKLNQYQRAGVREYWIVSPEERNAQVYVLENGLFHLNEVYTDAMIGKVSCMDGCFVELSKVFSE